MQEIEMLYKELKQTQKLFKSNHKIISKQIDLLIYALIEFKKNCAQES